MKESYGTLSETVNGLKKEGYTHDFNIREDCIVCNQSKTNAGEIDFRCMFLARSCC